MDGGGLGGFWTFGVWILELSMRVFTIGSGSKLPLTGYNASCEDAACNISSNASGVGAPSS
jgi:hypothetical protein